MEFVMHLGQNGHMYAGVHGWRLILHAGAWTENKMEESPNELIEGQRAI